MLVDDGCAPDPHPWQAQDLRENSPHPKSPPPSSLLQRVPRARSVLLARLHDNDCC